MRKKFSIRREARRTEAYIRNRDVRPHNVLNTPNPALSSMVTSASKLGPAAFLEAEARGSRIRQKNFPLDREEAAHIKAKSRITLAKVKGYWE